MIHHFANQVIGVANHRPHLIVFFGNIGLQRSGRQGQMHQRHGIIDKEWAFLVLGDEIKQELVEEIRTKFSGIGFAPLLAVDVGIPVALVADLKMLVVIGILLPASPHEIFIKAMLNHGIGLKPEIIHLPLTGRCGLIAGGFHHLPEAWVRLPVIVPHAPAGGVPVVHPSVAEGILPSEKAKTRRGALGHRIGIDEFRTRGRQPVDIGRLNPFRSVTADPLLAQIIEQDEHNIRLGGLFWSR